MSHLNRVISLDQFRGYSVVGMFMVNFLGHIETTHHLLKHNNTHFSLADSIMPSFILISGYSYRLTLLKRLESQPLGEVQRRFLWRSLGLILLSLMFFGFGSKVANFEELSLASTTKVFVELLKANLWEVLAIIGACQILLLPLIASSIRIRIVGLLVLTTGHCLLTGWFNWNFVYGLPNGLDSWLGTTGKRAWDGGLFGLLSWSEIMLLGTLLPDMVHPTKNSQAVWRLLGVGACLMMLGYLGSCLTRLYDRPPVNSTYSNTTNAEVGPATSANVPLSIEASATNQNNAPVFPDWSRLQNRPWHSLLAEPPLVPPPGRDLREPNYWAMDKRIVSQTFVYFSAGFAISLFGLFVLICDVGGYTLRPFTTFGQNPLAAYLIHHIIEVNLQALFPRDSTGLWATVGMITSIAITYLFVRFLEVRSLFLRL